MKNSITIAAVSIAVAWGGYTLSDFAGLVPHSTTAAVITSTSVATPEPRAKAPSPQEYLTREGSKVFATDTSLIVSWLDRTGDELGFEIHRSTTFDFIPDTTYVVRVGTDVTSYEDVTVVPDLVYYYKVRAILPGNPPALSKFSKSAYGWVEKDGKSLSQDVNTSLETETSEEEMASEEIF
ncbi:MAG: hypothetical protein V4519_04625 [Patescibacteria group bacterium]